MLGKCKRCNKKLTLSESIIRGYGETCYKKHIKELNKEFERNQLTIFHFLGGIQIEGKLPRIL